MWEGRLGKPMVEIGKDSQLILNYCLGGWYVGGSERITVFIIVCPQGEASCTPLISVKLCKTNKANWNHSYGSSMPPGVQSRIF